MSEETARRLRDLLDLYTKHDPERRVRIFSTFEVNSINALWKAAGKIDGVDVCRSTMLNFVRKRCNDEGSVLLRLRNDHNVCHVCKSFTLLVRDIEQRLKVAKIKVVEVAREGGEGKGASDADGFEATAEQLDTELEEANVAWAEHVDGDIQQRRLIRHFRKLGRKLFDERTQDQSSTSQPFCSVAGICMFHFDDKSADDLPLTPLATTGVGARYRFAIAGHFDMIHDTQTNYIAEQGIGSKDSNLIADEVVLNILERCNGEKTLVLVADCASLNKNAKLLGGLPQWLVDHGFFETVVTLLYWELHGKVRCFLNVYFDQHMLPMPVVKSQSQS